MLCRICVCCIGLVMCVVVLRGISILRTVWYNYLRIYTTEKSIRQSADSRLMLNPPSTKIPAWLLLKAIMVA